MILNRMAIVKIRAILGASILLLVSVPVNATLINYTVAGDLSLFEGTDAYSLDGASFVWEIGADTSLAHVGSFSQIGCCQLSSLYPSLTSTVTFTDRSNGATDTTINASLPLLQTVNAENGSGALDIFEIRFSQLTGEFETATMGGFSASFDSSLYDDGVGSLPEQLDFTNVLASNWGAGIVSNVLGLDLSFHSQYSVSNWSISVSPVPVPATLWLFGTGLIGLIGFSKRRKTA